ncbi:sterol desaturase family protein [Marinobacter sediminum]|uniref:sterol desaturase family protein n=1 Tax=Marinobacter sediminum TaxID=256323 RepID=UPI0019394DFB|nr:sterol desaturase family protein [Marinobacter sediminum]
MDLTDMLLSVLEDSGLRPLWDAVSPWLALDERQLIFVIATPVFIAVAMWEYLRIRHNPALMDTREAIRNFALGAGYQTTELLFAGIIAFPVFALCYHYRFFELELTWLTAFLTFLGVEFCFYWMHRASHRMRWFWAAHVVHHSSERMNFSTAMRQNATNIVNGNWLFYLPLALLGFNPVWIGIAYALSLVYQFFIHTTLIGRLPRWIEWVFNTPSHHRVHHGRNPGYIDRNYGGVLIIWDRLFGSFVDENAQDPPEYGITRPAPSNNLLVLWTHEYVDLFRDMARPGGLWSRLRHLWKPPEWERPASDDSGTTHARTPVHTDQPG